MLEELKAAYEAATPGKWAKGLVLETRHTLEPETTVMEIVDADGSFVACVNEPNDKWQANAEFIALAHNAMPALLKALEFVEMVSRMTTQAEDLENGNDFGDYGADVNTLEYLIDTARKLQGEVVP